MEEDIRGSAVTKMYIYLGRHPVYGNLVVLVILGFWIYRVVTQLWSGTRQIGALRNTRYVLMALLDVRGGRYEYLKKVCVV